MVHFYSNTGENRVQMKNKHYDCIQSETGENGDLIDLIVHSRYWQCEFIKNNKPRMQ